MKHQTFNNKRVIWESKTKQVAIIITCLLFTVVAIYARQSYSPCGFWITLILFGGGGLWMLIELVNPKALFVTPQSDIGKQIIAEQFEQQQEDLGFFTYDDTGFSVQQHNGSIHCNWAEIKSIFGYKEDRFTADEVCLDIFTSYNYCVKLTEDTPGWYQFNNRLVQHFPAIPKDWDQKIWAPAFDTKLTLLFDKDGRSQEEAEAEYY